MPCIYTAAAEALHMVLDSWSSFNLSQVAVSRFRQCLPCQEARVRNLNNGHHDENSESASFDSLQAIVGLLVRLGHENIRSMSLGEQPIMQTGYS